MSRTKNLESATFGRVRVISRAKLDMTYSEFINWINNLKQFSQFIPIEICSEGYDFSLGD